MRRFDKTRRTARFAAFLTMECCMDADRGNAVMKPHGLARPAGNVAATSLILHIGTPTTMKTVYTTGEAAKICKVSQQTIIRCFDSGQLKGFRVPGSRFRRIPREALYRFMKENNIPTDALESGRRRILIVDDDQAVVDLISEVLSADARLEAKFANNSFEAGVPTKEYPPD